MAIVEVRVIPIGDDSHGQEVAMEARRSLSLSALASVTTAKVYRLQDITAAEAEALAIRLFTDPLTQSYALGSPVREASDHIVEIAYKPGVMNPEVASIMKAAHDLGIRPSAADTSREYTFHGHVDSSQVDEIVGKLLLNGTIEHIVTAPPKSLTFTGSTPQTKIVPVRHASDFHLAELSKDKLFLDAAEMSVVRDYFRKLKRDPTDVELEIIAARWSEHCGHKTFSAKIIKDGQEKPPLFTRIKKAARMHFKDLVVQAFDDNSGVMRFYDGQAICGKVETHNSPSAIEPYGGAMTGSGGVFRDIMGTGQGAKTIISTDMFCFAPPDLDESLLPPGTLHPDYLQRRVIQGIRDYGNRMGIPTGNGSVHYHEDFRATPTVIAGAYGILPEKRAHKGEPRPGDQLIILGGPTGRDGIHGATFSSGSMTQRTAQVNGSAVQIGNAIEEKRMFDALLAARDLDLIRAMTDCGAAGFSSAIGEIGEHTGVTVELSLAPVKYPGLAPWEIWLSESQERMVTAVSPENAKQFLAICKEHNVEAVVLGTFNDSHKLTVKYSGQVVASLDYSFLQDGLPQRVMTANWTPDPVKECLPAAPTSPADWVGRIKAVLAHGDVCSKEPIVRQYDHGVQGGNIVPPFGGVHQDGPNDALVIRPLLGKPYGMVQSHGMNPGLVRLNPYKGTIWAIAEAAANYVSAGGDLKEATGVGNYVWPSPDERMMGSLDLAVDAATDMMHVLDLPVISGKDSLSSTYRGADGLVIQIPPVYAMSIFGRIPDVTKTMTTDFKAAGSTLVLVGLPSSHMGGSSYYNTQGASSAHIPHVDTKSLPLVLQGVHEAISGDHVLSCHDVSEGGLITTIAEMCFGGDLGAELTIAPDADAESYLFSETAGCLVLELAASKELRTLFKDIPYQVIGKTTPEKLLTASQHSSLFRASIDELKDAWQAPMKEVFHR